MGMNVPECIKNDCNKKRIIALDVGTVRIGVSVSDPTGSFAQGVAVLLASGEWMEELSGLIGDYGASVILVGMPRRTDGVEGPEAERMREIMGELSRCFSGVDVVSWDERFTTTIANQALIEADVSRKGRKGRVDKVAATLLLQSYLDSRRADLSAGFAAPAETAALFPCANVPSRDDRKGRKRKNNYD
jgi:putative Holliday junction resolvase